MKDRMEDLRRVMRETEAEETDFDLEMPDFDLGLSFDAPMEAANERLPTPEAQLDEFLAEAEKVQASIDEIAGENERVMRGSAPGRRVWTDMLGLQLARSRFSMKRGTTKLHIITAKMVFTTKLVFIRLVLMQLGNFV